MICVLSGRGAEASPSNVIVVLTTSLLPPASDMMMAFWPPGPTSRMSISSGQVWSSEWSVTFTSVIDAGPPATTILAGYGVAVPELGICIIAGLANVCPPVGTQAVGVGVAVAHSPPIGV